MKYLITVFKDYTHPYLDRLLADIKMNGIEMIPVKAVGECKKADEGDRSEALLPLDEDRLNEVLAEENRKHSYILTDCNAGVKLAGQYRTGYVYYDIMDGGIPDSITGSDETPQCIIQGFDEINADFILKMYQRYHHLPWMILTTERLLLREMTVDDVDRLYEIYSGEGMTEYTEPLYEDRQQEIEYTRDYIKNMYEFCGYGLWIVVERDSGRIVGRAGITGREGYDEAEIGYIIEKDRQRRGYAAEACTAIIGYARDVLEMSGLNCFVYPGNEASVKLCKLLGFEHIEDVVLSGKNMMRYHISF